MNSEMAELLTHLDEEMKMEMKRKLLGAVALFAMLAGMEANAQTADLDVSAIVPEACIITSPDPLVMDFGIVDPVNGAGGGADYVLDRNFEFECSVGTAGTVELGLGGGATPTLTERFMQGSGANELGYRLEQVSGADFGTGADGIAFVGSGFGTTITATIRGVLSVAQMQLAQADTYNDTVLITLTL
jgi:spore coat protein U-like protein